MIPLVAASLSFLLGAGAGFLPPPGALLFLLPAVLVAAAIAALAALRRDRRAFLLLALALLLLGACRTLEARRDFLRAAARFPAPETGSFTARVVEDPEVILPRKPGDRLSGREGGFYHPRVEKVRVVLEIVRWNGEVLEPFRVRATFFLSPSRRTPVLSYGDTVEGRGRLGPPRPACNFGEFDYAAYLRAKGIPLTLYGRGEWRRGGVQSGNAFFRLAFAAKRRLEAAVYRALPHPQGALLAGLLFGERADLPEHLIEAFTVSGTVHILAVSGMNTALVTGLLFWLLRLAAIPRKPAALGALAGLAIFTVMTGAPPSVCRAGLLSAFALLAVLLERRPHGGTLLCAAAALLTAWNPFALADLSFQLSFLATLGLFVGVPFLYERLKFFSRPVAGVLAATLAAQGAVTLLLIHHFHQVAVYTVPANLLTAPLVAAATAAGGLAALAGSLVPLLGDLLGAVAGVPLALILHINEWIAALPGAAMRLAAPPPAVTVLVHVLLGALIVAFWPRPRPEAPSPAWRRREKRWKFARRGVLLAAAAAGATLALGTVAGTLREDPFRAAFLAVGHGDAVVLEAPGGRVFVVDGGRPTEGPPRWNPVVGYLRHRGVRRVSGILNTHPDADHVGGLTSVLEDYPVEAAYLGAGARADSRTWRRLLEALRAEGLSPRRLRRGDRIEGFGDVRLEILHPPTGFATRRRRDNNRSLAVRVTAHGRTLLLPGDLEREGLEALLAFGPPGPVDVLLAPHHGRASGEPALAAEAFRPRLAVLSDGRFHPESAARFLQAGALTAETARLGGVELEIRRDGTMRWRSFRDRRWRSLPSFAMERVPACPAPNESPSSGSPVAAR